MTDYTKLTDFAAKDALAIGVPEKLVMGAELDAEFEAIEAAIASKTDGIGNVAVGDYGDITVSAGGATWTLDTATVTLAKMANLAASKFIARATASTGVPEAVTFADFAALAEAPDADDPLLVYDASASAHKQVAFKYAVGIPQNAQDGNYTVALTDNGKHILHSSSGGAGDTYTIPANASVALPIGFTVTFVNLDATNNVSIAITTDTMYLAGSGTTGTRTLGTYGWATAMKVASTTWIIYGAGLA